MDDEHPEWLPLDWKVCVRVRSTGKKDKYYINPQGIKFNSKPEALRYLKNAEKDLKLKTAENDLKLKTAENDLKLKIAENDLKLKTAENDLKFKNPENDLQLKNAEKDLKLKNAENDLKLKNAENDQQLKEPNKPNFQKAITENLPEGWIKEIKITKKGRKTRKDPYYIDPVSGRLFRSMQEVYRYLETKDSGKAESNGDDTNHPTEDLGDHSKSPTTVAEERRLIDEKEDKALAASESLKSVENIDVMDTHTNGQSEKDPMVEDQKQEKATPQNKRKKSKWTNELPRRASKRLAGVEADTTPELKSSNGARAVRPRYEASTAENSGKSDIKTSEDFGKQKQPSSVPPKDIPSVEEHKARDGARDAEVSAVKYTGKSEIHKSGDFSKQKEVSNVPVRDISSSEEHEAVGIDFKKDDKNEKDHLSSLNHLLMDPCIEFAIKTLTGAIPIEDVSKVHDSAVASRASANPASGSSSALPFGNILADPCFEFAVKTLTSEIPTEDSSRFRISFEQPVRSSGASGFSTNTIK